MYFTARPGDESYPPQFEPLFGRVDAKKGHPLHLDNSDVTMNVCLGDTFEGGDLQFTIPYPWAPKRPAVKIEEPPEGQDPYAGLMARRTFPGEVEDEPPVRYENDFSVRHQIGKAVIHPGAIQHKSEDLRKGERFNLIRMHQLCNEHC